MNGNLSPEFTEGSKGFSRLVSSDTPALLDPLTYHVYILICADGTYYVGQTENLEKRMAEHDAGNGSRHTAARVPVELVYSEAFASRAQAMARESQLKKWSRAKKEALIADDTATLRSLSESRD